MNPITFALRRPLTIVVLLAALVIGSLLALSRLAPERIQIGGFTIPIRSVLPIPGMPFDIFPDMGVPIIYVAQPYGGMDPGQMEGFITYYFEYHFLYITGIHHVESRNIQGLALMKLYFHPGTNMAQAMAETVGYVNRAQSFMPPGTVPPFIMRFDAGSVPVGYLVFESKTRSIGEVQDVALNKVRPMFASLPGVSAPPPFGGNQRTIVVTLKPDSLNQYNLSPETVVTALSEGNVITPSGSVTLKDSAPMVPVNSVVKKPADLGGIVVRQIGSSAVYLSDVARIEDATDVPTGYGLVNGRRSVYILVTKRADASTLSVVNEVKANLPRMKEVLPEGIDIRFEFDQSSYIKRALWGVGLEGLLGAVLTGLMVLVFLRDWRSVIIVVLNIPFALLGSVLALWVTGQTINLMTLGGLALAVGILVDEATVEVENIHTQMDKAPSIAWAVRLGNAETALPRLLAMLCILAVFVPSLFMQGSARALFVPLSLAVGFAMITSYFLSSTFVPVASVWLLRGFKDQSHDSSAGGRFVRFRERYVSWLKRSLKWRWILLSTYAGSIVVLIIWWALGHPGLGTEIFPPVDAGQFQLRVRAPEGTPLEGTEALAHDILEAIGMEVGPENVDITVTLVGTASYNYPINSIYLWTAGPQEAVLRVALKAGSGVSIESLKTRLRESLPQLERKGLPSMKDVKLSFEAGDIVAEVMSFGSPSPIEIAVSGNTLEASRAYAERLREEMVKIKSLRDLQQVQSMNYPALEVTLNRQLLGQSGSTVAEVARALPSVTLSSRFIARNFWRDPTSGIGYQVQVQLGKNEIKNKESLENIPIGRENAPGKLVLGDVSTVREATMPGQYDRYNMRRLVSLTANLQGEDLGHAADRLNRAIKSVGDPPTGTTVDLRGQIVPMQQMFQGLGVGLALAVVVILLLLAANFQSWRLALVVISTLPGVIMGVLVGLVVTGTTLNIQSFMGAIMAQGVAVANAILLVTFAEKARLDGAASADAGEEGGRHRLRPILMTSCAMIAGMIPMSLGLGEGGEQTAPLGRAVVGGLLAATALTLFILPCMYAVILRNSHTRSVSLDPEDPLSTFHEAGPANIAQDSNVSAPSPSSQPG